ncbi:hypothetical protein BWQ96_08456 [Gracilariopsis chorda]|uniref:Uncharacterized protein n=1 Tax=Gracilariopsis chorda TaxID=448386 RepID=A0A2V3IIE0_9FLOR|nr:hypothetical protein BWQ96_08456 [Gracilariopsis chorda]|eukprot:PXF41808.1 hypothetical protein BWQ96_08456 [Gracilariopsis chorda]
MPSAEQRRSGRKRRIPQRLAEEEAPVKKTRKETKRSDLENKLPQLLNLHKPCKEVLFLHHGKAYWQPASTDIRTVKCMDNIYSRRNSTLHSYFISPQAGKDAARATDKICIFRHIGAVTLNHCSFVTNVSATMQLKTVHKSTDQLVNFLSLLEYTKCQQRSLLHALESLALPDSENWNVPYIVLMADRKDVLATRDSAKKTKLNLQVYVGRMLFELIACNDIKTLFNALVPSQPFTPIPKLQQFAAAFPRSKLPSCTSSHSCEAILQRAESTGYRNLTDEQRCKIEDVLTVPLYPFQEQTVSWMLDKENDRHCLNDYFWEERFFTKTDGKDNGSFFYFPLTGEVRVNRPPRMRGGMVTEEMGLGKTIEALALIAAQKTEQARVVVEVQCQKKPNDMFVDDGIVHMKRLKAMNKEQAFSEHLFHHGDLVREDLLERAFPQKVKVSRWPARTTLVICPQSLLGQWRQEAVSKAPSLSLYVWGEGERDDDDDCDDAAFAVGETAVDIVLTTYETVRKDPLLSMITWRRVILDEAQFTRRSSTQIARDVFNLRSNTRFLMTGTPVVGSIDDFKGELATLRIWPFTLENDGFWEKHVLGPRRSRVGSSLLSSLLDVTMIRHTKAQGLHLSMPERTYETLEVDLVGSHRSCYCYILAITMEELESQAPGDLDTRRLRLLLKFLLWVSLSSTLVDIGNLDIARRNTWARGERMIHGARDDDEDPEMRQVSGRAAIEFVASTMGGIVRQTLRSFAMEAASSTGADSSNILEEYLHMPIERLRQEVAARGVVPVERVPRLRRERLAALAAGGVHRLATDTLQELRETAVTVGVVSEDQAKILTRTAAMAKLKFHYDRENGVEVKTVHESGFVAITKLIEGKGNPTCPVCLTECDDRVTVTKCGHLYCHGCMSLMLSTRDSQGYYRKPQCALCRRELSQNLVAEIVRTSSDADEPNSEAVHRRELSVAKKTQVKTKGRTGRKKSRRRSARRSSATNLEGQDADRSAEFVVPTSSDAWCEYTQLGQAPDRFMGIGANPRYPSIDASFLRHVQAASQGLESPKLSALLTLIESRPVTTKFCVVAGSVMSLGVINEFLKKNGVKCVGVGVQPAPQRGRRKTKTMTDASEAFSTDPTVRVFLLNPANSSGLNLIAAEYVVFLETLVRVADEVQAAARVHRIGQTKNVKIVRIVARNTIDEQIAWERREATNPAQESHIMSSLSQRDASDSLILRLFGHVLQQN